MQKIRLESQNKKTAANILSNYITKNRIITFENSDKAYRIIWSRFHCFGKSNGCYASDADEERY
jgi:hypothetical protein